MAIAIEDIISDFKFSLIPYFIKKPYNKLLIIIHFVICVYEVKGNRRITSAHRFVSKSNSFISPPTYNILNQRDVYPAERYLAQVEKS